MTLDITTAKEIAESQFDLGGPSRLSMAQALAGQYPPPVLDPLTREIVNCFEEADGYEDAATNLKYHIKCYQAALDSLNRII